MTADQKKQIDAIEKDRRKREEDLLLALLFWTMLARRMATHAVRIGHDPLQATRDVLLGNQKLEMLGIVPAIQAAMAKSHQDGYLQAAKSIGVEVKPPETDVMALYKDTARWYAEKLAGAADKAVRAAVRSSMIVNDGTIKRAAAVKQAFADAGLTTQDPFVAVATSISPITSGYQVGMFDRFGEDDAQQVVTGFEHISVLDQKTTKICQQRDGLKLPANHPYWSGPAWPALHWSCRSCVLPIRGSFEPSTVLPTIPAAPGFGYGTRPVSAF